MAYAGSSARPSCVGSLGALMMLITTRSMRAHMSWISPHPFQIKTLFMIWNVSGLDMMHMYWLDMRPSGLSNDTHDFNAIWCGCMLSIIAIQVCIVMLSKQNSVWSNLSRRARCRERTMSVLAVHCGKTSVVWFGVLRPCLELVSGPAAVSYFLVGI